MASNKDSLFFLSQDGSIRRLSYAYFEKIVQKQVNIKKYAGMTLILYYFVVTTPKHSSSEILKTIRTVTVFDDYGFVNNELNAAFQWNCSEDYDIFNTGMYGDQWRLLKPFMFSYSYMDKYKNIMRPATGELSHMERVALQKGNRKLPRFSSNP